MMLPFRLSRRSSAFASACSRDQLISAPAVEFSRAARRNRHAVRLEPQTEDVQILAPIVFPNSISWEETEAARKNKSLFFLVQLGGLEPPTS